MATMAKDQQEPEERTPLLQAKTVSAELQSHGNSLLWRLLLCGFMVSLSFGVTQVPLLYVFRLMTCEAYYTKHPEPPPGTDRCDNHEIEAGTALAFSLLAASTTIFGVFNLFVTNWSIKKYGVKTSLAIQVFWPAVRVFVQNIGIMVGGEAGILIVQCSQIMTIVGGPSGYLLSLNSFIAEVVEQKERTGALGRLQGCTMFGTSIGYLIGGVLSDAFDIRFPFKTTFFMFMLCSLFVLVALPSIKSKSSASDRKPTTTSNRFFGPLKIFVPQKWVSRDGVVRAEYGASILGIGVFFGILATGYIPILLQMYATDVLNFGTSQDSYLVSIYALTRGCFLTFAFPRIISSGRQWFEKRRTKKHSEYHRIASIPHLPGATEYISSESAQDAEEPIEPPKPAQSETYEFDLFYTKFSLLLDGVLTAVATFVRSGNQIYFVAGLIALASGTGSSAKGTILQMCPSGNASDALSAITLVDMAARLLTTTIFGMLFALLAKMGRAELIFIFNAAIALVGFTILLFARFPAEDSTRVLIDEENDES